MAPFAVGLVVTLLLHRTRFGGLAVVAAFFTAVFLMAGFTFTPLSATRKIFVAGLVAPLAGMVLDTLPPPRSRWVLPAALALAAAGAGLWVFWPLLAQKSAAEAWQKGAGMVAALAWMVAFGQVALASNGVRAGSALLGTALGLGIAAIFAASATYGTYGIALGAGAGAFLLVQMIRGRHSAAGATLMLPGALLCALLAAGTMLLAQLPLASLLVLALAPLGAWLPLPGRMPAWLQAGILSLCTLLIAGLACFLAWRA